jgi:hypothetical protein
MKTTPKKDQLRRVKAGNVTVKIYHSRSLRRCGEKMKPYDEFTVAFIEAGARKLPPLTKATAAEWNTLTWPLFLAIYGNDHETHPAFSRINSKGRKNERLQSIRDAIAEAWLSIAKPARRVQGE